MSMKYITEIGDVTGKRVLVRVDCNVSLGDDNLVQDDEALRIKAVLPTLEFLRSHSARTIIISHIGREPHETLVPIAEYMNKHLRMPVKFIPALGGELVEQALDNMQNGDMVMLENLRSSDGEESNDEAFAKTLASYADIYVNDAFSVSHRNHASLVGIPLYLPSFAGFHMLDEIKHLDRVRSPEHPIVVIIGGAKFETKLDLMKQLLPTANAIIIGGALANRIYKERGFEIGNSKIDTEGDVTSLAESEKVLLARDVITEQGKKSIQEMTSAEKILDNDIHSIPDIDSIIKNAKTILWNGPFGYYEGGFVQGTQDMAHLIAESDATSIVGGGDTVVILFDEKILDKFTFVSMAGGAMLDYLIHGTLPGIEALNK